MIRCIDLSKVYRQGDNEIVSLAGVSLDIARGKFAVIMGPSGSGKSTLLHLIGGLDRPTSGDLLVNGHLLASMDDSEITLFRRTQVGFVFQFFNLLPTLTALENVALPFVLDGQANHEAEARAESLLAKVGLEARKTHRPEALSGGEIQRIAIARALAFNPPILLADEPTGNLDSKNGGAILALLKKINVEQGCTVVMVTHSQDAAVYGDFVIELRDGHIVDTGGSVRGDNEAGSTTTGESGAASSPDD
jgi:putative ABC transport system ATP-binding protein